MAQPQSRHNITVEQRVLASQDLSSSEPAAIRPATTGFGILLPAAVRGVYAVIEHDLKRAPSRLRPMLAYIRIHLFDRDLNVDGLKRACQVRSNWVPTQFHSALGESPWSYIELRRMEAARALLVGTPLAVWRIAKLLGYSSIHVFSRAFRRREGETARAYRRRQWPAGTTAASLWTVEDLDRVLSGGISLEEARTLLTYLLWLYPGGRRAARQGGFP